MSDPEDPTPPAGERPPAPSSATPESADSGTNDDTAPVEPATPSAPNAPPEPPAPPTPPATTGGGAEPASGSVAPTFAPPPTPEPPPAPEPPAASAPPPPPPAHEPPPAAGAGDSSPSTAAMAPGDTRPASRPRPPVEYEESAEVEVAEVDAAELPPIPRWVTLVNTLGVGLVTVIAAELITSVLQGFSYAKEEPQGVASDLLHRLGYPFAGNTWILSLSVLVLAVLLISLPVLFDEDTTYGQERAASIALVLVVVVTAIVCLGSILAVRANLHLVTAGGRSVPDYYRVDLATFLIGTLGTGVLAIYGALVARSMRFREG